MLRSTSCAQVSVWVKTLYGFVSKMPIWGIIGRSCVVAPRGTCPTLGGDHVLTRRNLVAAAITLTVLATAACAGGDAAVQPTGARAGLRPRYRLHEILVRPGAVRVQCLHPSVVVTGSEDGGRPWSAQAQGSVSRFRGEALPARGFNGLPDPCRQVGRL